MDKLDEFLIEFRNKLNQTVALHKAESQLKSPHAILFDDESFAAFELMIQSRTTVSTDKPRVENPQYEFYGIPVLKLSECIMIYRVEK